MFTPEQLRRMVKTATFDYTEMAEVESSFIDTVFYNDKTEELAVLMLNGYTHFYGDVPARVFYSIVDGASAGAAYNREVKDKFKNLGNGPVHDVKFVEHEVGVTKTFDIIGQYKISGQFSAESAAEAARKFLDETKGYYGDNVIITEVIEVG